MLEKDLFLFMIGIMFIICNIDTLKNNTLTKSEYIVSVGTLICGFIIVITSILVLCGY